MRILGIETSCDETAAAIVTADRRILSHEILSQQHIHGGVVPEVAARAHLTAIIPLLKKTLDKASLSLSDLDGIAATCGPGLIGGVLVGAMTGKALAMTAEKPFIAINHLEGHALTVRLTQGTPYPYLLLLVSGGHCQFIVVEDLGHYTLLGQTLDDALGECFDKVARMLELPYPGGPAIEKLALSGDACRFSFPHPLCRQDNCDFSFSGLKTAVRFTIEKFGILSVQDKSDLAASFQETVSQILKNRVLRAIDRVPHLKTFVLSGGVAANQMICHSLKSLCESRGISFVSPPVAMCTDNGAMIAWAGIERLQRGWINSLDFAPRPRWPLCEQTH